jgi:hypothetical protein
VKIAASTLWKPLVTTAVPLELFRLYPQPGMDLKTLLATALATSGANIGLTLPFDFGAFTLPIATPYTAHPNEADINDPTAQSWAAYLMGMLTVAGVECFAREDGVMVLRDLQALQNPALAGLPAILDAETFASSGGGVSDANLVTNAVVTWGVGGTINNAVIAPDNGLASVGPLPPQLTGADGKPLDQIGKRFVSYTADFLNSVADAKQYAGNVRSVGMAGIDTFQASVALNGDLRIGTHVLAPRYDRRYYVTTVGHYFEDQVDAETDISGNYGVPTNYAWNQAAIGGTSNFPLGDLLGNLDGSAASSPVTAPANIPAPADASDPDVRWLAGMRVISAGDITGLLGNVASPFRDQAAFIWSEAQKYGINPAFALAVWQEECGLGVNTAAVTDIANHNPGSLGVYGGNSGAAYPTWAAGIDAWFQIIAGKGDGYVGDGKVTVSQIATVYDPKNAASWAGNVTQIMLALIASAKIPAVQTPGTQPAPGATGSIGAMAAYAAPLAQSIPTQKVGTVKINNVIVPGTPLGDFARKAGFSDVECTTMVEYLLGEVAKVAGVVNADGTINTGPNAAQWGGYLTGLGFHNFTGVCPVVGQILLYQPYERDPKTGKQVDYSDGDGHVGVIVAVTPPDSHGAHGSVTVAAANVPDPVDTWTLTATGGLYMIGGLATGAVFGSTPFSWWGI